MDKAGVGQSFHPGVFNQLFRANGGARTAVVALYCRRVIGNGNCLVRADFAAELATDIGSVGVQKTTTGGRCEITTDTGDIRIKIER